jgi:hypothetical protein
VYGLHVRSDVRLPIAPRSHGSLGPPDFTIRRVDSAQPPVPDGPAVALVPCGTHGADIILHRGSGGAWIWNHSIGTTHISPDFRQVDVYPDTAVDERALGLTLLGPVALFVLHMLGVPTLHASGVVTEHGAAVFLGTDGQGKSTLAASFLRRGATLLTDDALPLRCLPDGVHGGPGLPMMKVWQETAEHTLGLAEALPDLTADYDKKLLALDGRYAVATTPVPLRGIYVLDRYDPQVRPEARLAIRPLSWRESATCLIAQTSYGAFLRPAEAARLLPLYARLAAQAPVRVLSYPTGFAHQEEVCARIMADLEQG